VLDPEVRADDAADDLQPPEQTRAVAERPCPVSAGQHHDLQYRA
jgi:hypothetical protein